MYAFGVHVPTELSKRVFKYDSSSLMSAKELLYLK